MTPLWDDLPLDDFAMDNTAVREGAPSPEPVHWHAPSADELAVTPTPANTPAPETPASLSGSTDATQSLSDDTPMKSSPKTGSRSDMPPFAATIPDLLEQEDLQLQDVHTVQVDGEATKVIQKGIEWWKIMHEVVGGKDSFRLVHPRQAVKAAIVRHRMDQKDAKGKARNADATVSAKTEDIVDRIGDPGYKDWVTRVLKPRVQGSRRLVVTEAPRRETDRGGFWWTPENWAYAYRNDTDLGRVALNQIAVSPVGSTPSLHEAKVAGRQRPPRSTYLDGAQEVDHRRGSRVQAQGL